MATISQISDRDKVNKKIITIIKYYSFYEIIAHLQEDTYF